MAKQQVLEFFHRIKNEVEDILDESPNSVLAKIYTDILYDKGIITDYELLFFEKEINNKTIKINGVGINKDDLRVDLFISHYNPSPKIEEISINETQKLLEEGQNFYLEAITDLSKKINKKEEVYDFLKTINSLNKDIKNIRVFLLTNYKCEKKPKFISSKGFTFQNWVYDCEDIYEASLGGADSTDIEIDFSKFDDKVRCLLAQKNKNGLTSYMAIIPGEVLSKIYDLYGQRLLNLNVRSFLQLSGKINKGLRNTLLEEPENFFSYNNGIAVVCNKLEIKNDIDGSYVLNADGFQIVNGGQTTATIFRTNKQDGINFKDVMVPAKITVVDKSKIDEIVPKISEYANTQNVVKKADFSSNHEFHINFKDLSNKVRTPDGKLWFYERMRGEYQVKKVQQKDLGQGKQSKLTELSPPTMKFSKEDLAKFLNAWHYQLPHLVCRGAQKNFVSFMNILNERRFFEKVNEDFFKKYCCVSIIFNNAQKIIKSNSAIEGYRSQVLAYTVSLIAYYTSGKINFDIIWADQEISDGFKQLIEKWSTKIYDIIQKTADGKNVSEWCKNDECWNDIKDRSFSINPMPQELSVVKKGGTKNTFSRKDAFSAEDMDNIKKCKSLSANEWSKILAWGQQSGNLQYIQNQIALTIYGYAIGNWSKSPSPKQAKSAVKMITKAEESNII